MSSRALAITCFVSAIFAGCSQHSSQQPLSEAEKVIHLTNGDALEFRTAGDTTRPSLEIADGAKQTWPIPPGPARIVRTAYVSDAAGGHLFATTEWKTRSKVASCETAGDGQWRFWEFRIPKSGQSGHLEIRFRGASGNRPLVLAQPTLSEANAISPRIFILFDIDTLRKDHVSIYGYPQRTTPNIDHYFANGTVWDNAFSNIDWTLPSHVSMFTSTMPSRHGVGVRTNVIPPGVPLLAEQVQRAGYRTIAITNGGYVDPAWGFDRGFDSYCSTTKNVAEEIETLTSRIGELSGEPLFIFFHTYNVHAYTPSPWAAVNFPTSIRQLGPLWTETPDTTLRYLARAFPGEWRQWLLKRYDTSLYDVDHSFGTLVDFLETTNLRSRTAILLTSDHGEELFDRPVSSDNPFTQFGHNYPLLYDEVLRIPLLLSSPGTSTRQVRSEDVSLLDVAPTILTNLGVPVPPAYRGRSLLPSPADLRSRIVAAEQIEYDAVVARLGNFKMIRRGTGPFENPWSYTRFEHLPQLECFDTDADPFERHPIPCKTAPGRLHEAIDRMIARRFPGSIVFRITPPDPALNDPIYFDFGPADGHLVSSFGFSRDSLLLSEEGHLGARVESGEVSQYLAFMPPEGRGSIELSLYAGDSRTKHLVNLEPDTSYRWADLVSARLAPEPICLFTTPHSRQADIIKPVSAELVRRLTSLGYLFANGFGAERPAGKADSGAAGLSPAMLDQRLVHLDRLAREPRWRRSPPITERSARPEIEQLRPSETHMNSRFAVNADGSCTLEVAGKNFEPGDRVWWEVEMLPTEFVDSTLLRARVSPERLGRIDQVLVSVKDFGVARFSRPAKFTIRAR